MIEVVIDGQALLAWAVSALARYLLWELPANPIYERFLLPPDSAYLAYRAAIKADGADLRYPQSDEPIPSSGEEAELWRNERFNGEMARSGEVPAGGGQRPCWRAIVGG